MGKVAVEFLYKRDFKIDSLQGLLERFIDNIEPRYLENVRKVIFCDSDFMQRKILADCVKDSQGSYVLYFYLSEILKNPRRPLTDKVLALFLIGHSICYELVYVRNGPETPVQENELLLTGMLMKTLGKLFPDQLSFWMLKLRLSGLTLRRKFYQYLFWFPSNMEEQFLTDKFVAGCFLLSAFLDATFFGGPAFGWNPVLHDLWLLAIGFAVLFDWLKLFAGLLLLGYGFHSLFWRIMPEFGVVAIGLGLWYLHTFFMFLRKIDEEKYCRQGFDYADKLELKQAQENFAKAIRLNPSNPRNYLNRAVFFLEQGDFERAAADCESALKASPRCAEAYYLRGRADQGRQQPGEAIADFGRAIETDPDMTDAYICRASVRQETKEYGLAFDDYNHALEIDPENYYAFFNRGNCFFDLNDFDAAIADYGFAIDACSDAAPAYYGRALAFFCKGEYYSSRDDLRTVLALGGEIEPEFVEALRERL
jgi:tetratricopeptide (TPR) repeat protein